jgi:hypothetical protein
MSMNDGGSAFPISRPDWYEGGMTLRDWFAGQALIAVSCRWGGTLGDIDNAAAQRSAEIAYRIADAMIAERSKP